MERTERQRQLETLISQHPTWGYSKLNRQLKADTGGGYRKQTLLDIKRKLTYRPSPTPRATERVRLITLLTQRLPNQMVRELRSLGFKDFEIAEVLSKKRKLKDGTFIDTTPPPTDGDTFSAMVQARRNLIRNIGKGDIDNGIVESYQDNGWVKEDSTLDFWQMFRRFFRDSGSPVIAKSKQTTIHFGTGNVADQKRRARERAKGQRETSRPVSERGTPVYTTDGKLAYYKPTDAKWDGKRWVRN
jgi:hypothetical protein